MFIVLIAASLLGLLSLLSLIFGIVALVSISRSKGALKGKGLAICGIVLSALNLFVFPAAFGLFLLVPASVAEDSVASPPMPESAPSKQGTMRHVETPPDELIGDEQQPFEPLENAFNAELAFECQPDDDARLRSLREGIASRFPDHGLMVFLAHHPTREDSEARFWISIQPMNAITLEGEALQDAVSAIESKLRTFLGELQQAGWPTITLRTIPPKAEAKSSERQDGK